MSRAGEGVLCNCDPSDHDYEQLARNCYPETIDKLNEEIVRLRSALEKYGRHLFPCSKMVSEDEDCTCGFSTAIQGESDGKVS